MALGAPQADTSEAASGPNADAEADPWYGYYGYGYRPYGYGYYGYRHGYGYYYGKRSADAEPFEGGEGGAFGWYGDHPELLGNREDPPPQAGYGPGYGGNRPANPYDPHYSPVIPGYSGY